MRSRIVWAAAVLSTALVAGGWLVQRGLLFRPAEAHASAPQLFAQVMARVQREYVDSLADSTLYLDAARGAVAELDDPGSVYVPASLLARNPDTLESALSGRTSGDASPLSHTQTLMQGAAYAAVAHLTDETAGALRRAIDSLVAGGTTQLVLDLRGVTDGRVPQAVAVARLFADRGQVIARVRGRRAMDSATYSAADQQRWPALRVALLADSTTAGAAEIVCGALQDHDRATIVGSRTAGIGGTTTVFHLQSGGAVALTTGAWFTPTGRPIQIHDAPSDGATRKPPVFHADGGRPVLGGGGIRPDVAVSAAPTAAPASHAIADDPVVRAALAALAKPTA